MSSLRLLTLSIFFMSALGCSKLEEKAIFDMDLHSSFTVNPAVRIDQPLEIAPQPVTTQSRTTLNLNNTNKRLIEEIRLLTTELRLETPYNGSLSFLESIDIYLSADNLPEIWLAGLEDVPDPIGKKLTLAPTDVDISHYIKEDQVYLRTELTLDEARNQEQVISVINKVLVDAIEDLN